METMSVREFKANFSEVLKEYWQEKKPVFLMEKEKKLWQNQFPKPGVKDLEEKQGYGINGEK